MRLIKAQTTNLRSITGRGVKYLDDEKVVIDSTNALTLPRGTSGQRPENPLLGDARFNTTEGNLEFYLGGEWQKGLEGEADNVFYVSKNGSDNNSGKTISESFQTIDYALSVIPEFSTLYVKTGDYTLNNPVTVPKRVAIVGDSLRTTTVRAGNPTQDMFYVNNGSYLTQLTFKDHISPAAAIAFNPDGSAGEIFQSPYVQNCTSLTTTGTGMRVDGRHAEGLKSMVVDAFTQYNQGGIGIHMLFLGNTQLVSVFTICCDIAILCEDGGFCSLTNSNSSFGNFGLKADGVSQPKYTGTVAQNISAPTFAGEPILINNLVNRPNSGDAVTFNQEEYYTISTTTALKVGKTEIENPDFTTESNELQDARTAVLNEKDVIKYSVIEFINTTYPTLDYNQSKFARDVGLIIDAAIDDMVFNTNYKTTVAARSYYNNSASLVLSDQKIETVAAIEEAKNLVLAEITDSQIASDRVEYNFDLIIDVINNGTEELPTLSLPLPTNASTAVTRAKTILEKNRDFIIEEGIAFIDENYTDLFYSEATFRRDISYIIDAIIYDIIYQGNSQVFTAGRFYYLNGVLQVGSGEKQATIDTFNYLRTVVTRLLLNIVVSPLNESLSQDTSTVATTTAQQREVLSFFDIIIGYLESGYYVTGLIDIEPPNFSSQAEDARTARNLILGARSKIQVDTITYLNENYLDFDFDRTKCSRDIGLIIDAVVDDMVFDTNYKSILAGKSYLRASASEVINSQLTETVDAINYAKNEVLALISVDSTTEQPEYQRISSNFDIIIDILQNGESAAPEIDFNNPNNINSNTLKAKNILLENTQFYIEEGIAYISEYFPSLTYSESACRKDLRFIIDAVIYDLVYGGNSQTIDAANEYYSGGNLQIPSSQKDATIEVYERIRNIVSDSVTNIEVNRLNTEEDQNDRLLPATSTEAEQLEKLLNIVIRLLQNGYIAEVSFDEPIDDNSVQAGTPLTFHQYSLITASGHTFEWVGSGTNINSALPYEGGLPKTENQVLEENGGVVYYTGTDQEGDFRIGGQLTINRTSGTIEGETFDRSLFAVLTPYILAIED
jgi:hypothetical protein